MAAISTQHFAEFLPAEEVTITPTPDIIEMKLSPNVFRPVYEITGY